MYKIWFLPFLLLISAAFFAFLFSHYLMWVMDGKYKPKTVFKSFERILNTGAQTWQQYAKSLIFFSITVFIFGYLILVLQPYLPLNPEHKTLLAPNSILHSAASFITNTNLQHYIGEKHLSNFSQIFFCITNFFISAATGICVLTAVIRALRSEANVGNFFIDMWRAIIYIFMPLAILFACIFAYFGVPMTYTSAINATTMEGATQKIVLGPVAAFEAIKMLGTNGGGFYAMNSAHPFENPTALANFFNMFAMLIFPFSMVFMYGLMLNQKKHSYVIFSVMLFCMVASISWVIYFDTLSPNTSMTGHGAKVYNMRQYAYGSKKLVVPEIPPLPVQQSLGNLEGKELRFGTSAGATFMAITTNVACGAINAEPDSLNPISSLSPLMGMWLNCFFGGKGVGMINMLMFIIIGIFLAGMMVGRTPEYLGKKIGVREIKLAIVGMLIHPMNILLPMGLFAATSYGLDAITNPGAHGMTQMLYQFSSASSNNGSAFNGLDVIYGFYNNPDYPPSAMAWDIATTIIMLISRFLPIIAALAMAAYLGAKKTSPYGIGTLHVDNWTFGFLLLGTLIIIGGLLFLPIATLGPIAEHLGPIPFGG